MRRAALALLLFACVATPVKAHGYSSDDLKRHMIERRGGVGSRNLGNSCG